MELEGQEQIQPIIIIIVKIPTEFRRDTTLFKF